jgi:hypothetical protein
MTADMAQTAAAASKVERANDEMRCPMVGELRSNDARIRILDVLAGGRRCKPRVFTRTDSLLKLAIETCGALSATARKTVKRAWVEIRYKHMVLGDVSHSSLEEEQRGRAQRELAIHRLGRITSCGALQFLVAALLGYRGNAIRAYRGIPQRGELGVKR